MNCGGIEERVGEQVLVVEPKNRALRSRKGGGPPCYLVSEDVVGKLGKLNQGCPTLATWKSHGLGWLGKSMGLQAAKIGHPCPKP